ncbi:hypothetical protein, partial [Klebsiella pneumoniae]|uniref:hypothetical protein n=1 Tax=Klebsiella pneumoniae TaxID=573 RepID=UPI001CF5EB71
MERIHALFWLWVFHHADHSILRETLKDCPASSVNASAIVLEQLAELRQRQGFAEQVALVL